MTAKEILRSGVLAAAANITDAYQKPKGNAPNAVDLHRGAGRLPNLDILGWPAYINIAKCLQLVRTAESFAAPTSIIGSNFVGANSDSSADPFAILDLPSAPRGDLGVAFSARTRRWSDRKGDARAAGHTGEDIQ